ASLPRPTAQSDAPVDADASVQDSSKELEDKNHVDLPPPARQAGFLLALVFAISWFTSTAMAAHLPYLLQASGLTLAGAVAVAALVGPAQVAARLMEFSFLRHMHPLLSAQLAALAHPVGAACLIIAGGPAAILFTL